MLVFFDTEFSDVIGIKHNPGLISIGCVAQDGREFYAEITDTWTKDICSPFVIEAVLPLLQRGEWCMTAAELAARLKAWIEGLTDEEVIFRSDAPWFDWPFVQEIFDDHGWPKNLRRECGSVSIEDERLEKLYNHGSEDYWKGNPGKRHHALHDARAIRAGWLATGL